MSSNQTLTAAKCYFVTFNAYEIKLEQISKLLPQTVPGSEANDFDIFVIALQGNHPNAKANMKHFKLKLDIFFNQSGKNIEPFFEQEGFIAESSAALLIYMKSSMQKLVDRHGILTSGFTSRDRTIEACLIKFKIDGTRFCITNVNAMTKEWSTGFKVAYRSFNDRLCDGIDYMADSNACVILGNFDSYLNVYEGKVTNALKKKKWENLFKCDPLRNMQLDATLLSNFKEIKIDFAPTRNYNIHSNHVLGYTDRFFYRSTKGCNVKPLLIHTRSGSRQYGPIEAPNLKFKVTKPVTAGLNIPIHNVLKLRSQLANLRVDKNQLPNIVLKNIQLNILKESEAAEGSIYLTFGGEWMQASVNNRAFFSKYGELDKAWSQTQLPSIGFKNKAIYAGIDQKVLQYQNMSITLMHQNGTSHDSSCGTAMVNLGPSFKFSGVYEFEEDILMQGAKVGTIKGVLKTKYGHRDEQLGKRSKGAKSDEADEENEEEMFDKKGKKKGKRKGGLFKKKFKLFAKKALVNKREMEDDDGKQPVLEITGAMEDYVNGDYYPFLKRLRSAIHAKEDTVFNTKLAYKNSHHVILASGTKNDVDGWIIELLGENLYFSRHNNEVEFPLHGFVSWTFSHKFNPIIKKLQDELPTKQELFETHLQNKIIHTMKVVQENTRAKLAIKRLKKKSSLDNLSVSVGNKNLSEAIHKFDDCLLESTSLAVEKFEKIKMGFLNGLIHRRRALDLDEEADKTMHLPVFGNAWGQEERVKVHIESDPTSTAIKLCQDERIKVRLPKLTTCPMRVKIEGVIAVSQVPILQKQIFAAEQQIDMYRYRLSKLYIKSATDLVALEEARDTYEGEEYDHKLRKLYEERLEILENGMA